MLYGKKLKIGDTIGLIGPTRMQYGKALSVLSQVGRSLNMLLEEQNDGHE